MVVVRVDVPDVTSGADLREALCEFGSTDLVQTEDGRWQAVLFSSLEPREVVPKVLDCIRRWARGASLDTVKVFIDTGTRNIARMFLVRARGESAGDGGHLPHED